MLTPHSRSLLLEALRPPDGYSLDQAIGTTFTLDLLTLLTAPLAFTFFDWEQEDGQTTADPLALLEALRRHADNIHIFCHAGMISVPPPDKRLLAYLEGSVIEVLPPRQGGIFHPKVWVLRFVSEDDDIRYRFLCLTRNLTFDRSWDTMLSVDGELTRSRREFSGNRPLALFLEALPKMAVRKSSQSLVGTVQQMASEVRRVEFILPEGFDDLVFLPLGIEGTAQWPFPDDGSRVLVLSPFLTAGFLEKLSSTNQIDRVISRPESFAVIAPDRLQSIYDRLYVLSPDADLDSNEGDDPANDQGTELAGLHAKLFITENGKSASVFTGSANATSGAYDINVEFLVELMGHRRHCGIQALLGQVDDEAAFVHLLNPYQLHDEIDAADEDEVSGERILDQCRRALAESKLQANVLPGPNEGNFTLQVLTSIDVPLELPGDVEAYLRPVTLQTDDRQKLMRDSHLLAEFPRVSFEALTSFFAFELRWTSPTGVEFRENFAFNLPLSGTPKNRKERLLQNLLENKDQVLRLLLLLLAEEGLSVSMFTEEFGHTGEGARLLTHMGHSTLLESLLRALERNPQSIEQAARIIDDLKSTPEGRKLLPDDLDTIWEPIWTAYQEIYP